MKIDFQGMITQPFFVIVSLPFEFLVDQATPVSGYGGKELQFLFLPPTMYGLRRLSYLRGLKN